MGLGVGLFQISEKDILFHLLWQPSALGGNLTMHSPKKTSFLLQFGQEENITGHSTERRAYWFVSKIARVFPVPIDRVTIGWWTLL